MGKYTATAVGLMETVSADRATKKVKRLLNSIRVLRNGPAKYIDKQNRFASKVFIKVLEQQYHQNQDIHRLLAAQSAIWKLYVVLMKS